MFRRTSPRIAACCSASRATGRHVSLKGYRSTWRLRDRAGQVATVEVKPRCIVSNALALRACTLLGLGPALVPRWIAGADLAAGHLVQLFPGHAATPTDFDSSAAWLLLPSRRYVPLKVRTFVDWQTDAFREGTPGERAATLQAAE
jgi:DNA-binding transcriptional LysR family regulator